MHTERGKILDGNHLREKLSPVCSWGRQRCSGESSLKNLEQQAKWAMYPEFCEKTWKVLIGFILKLSILTATGNGVNWDETGGGEERCVEISKVCKSKKDSRGRRLGVSVIKWDHEENSSYPRA